LTAHVITFGYAGIVHPAQLRDTLGPAIDVVVDVRLNAWSGNRAFSVGTADTVGAAGYDYIHLPALGNADFRTGGMRIADIEAITVVLDLVRAGNAVALMCACADPTDCHRRVLADEALRRAPYLGPIPDRSRLLTRP
jgi:uncharacterized protein (DUF488 family)